MATIFLGIVAIIQNNNANKANKMLQETQLLYSTYTCITFPLEARIICEFSKVSKQDTNDFSKVHCIKTICFDGDLEDELYCLNIEIPFNTNNQIPVNKLIIKGIHLAVSDKSYNYGDTPETWCICRNLNDNAIPSTWKYRMIYKDYRYMLWLKFYFRKSDIKGADEVNFGFNCIRIILQCDLTNAFEIVTSNDIRALYEIVNKKADGCLYKTLSSSSDLLKTPYKT